MVVGVAGAGLAGCGPFDSDGDLFVIRVQSIVAPALVPASDTLRIRFTGAIGPDGCWNLARVDRRLTDSTLDITFVGVHDASRDHVCVHQPQSLDHEEAIPPPLRTPFTISARQPDGSLLHRVVTVQ